jgi:hypothetical protein
MVYFESERIKSQYLPIQINNSILQNVLLLFPPFISKLLLTNSGGLAKNFGPGNYRMTGPPSNDNNFS